MSAQRKLTGIILSVALLVTCYIPLLWVQAESTSQTADENPGAASSAEGTVSYRQYLALHHDKSASGKTVALLGDQYLDGVNVSVIENLEGSSNVLRTEETGSVTYRFSVEAAGMYAIRLKYYPLEGNGNTIQRTIYLDGKIPVDELNGVEFSRVFQDDGEIESDRKGNDIRPSQTEYRSWMTGYVKDNYGYYGDKLSFYLEPGIHTVTLESLQEPMAIGEIALESLPEETRSYEEYLNQTEAEGAKKVTGVLPDGLLMVQAEDTLYKSDLTLYPTSDVSSYRTIPYDYAKQKLNMIGGTKWQDVGQWASWEIEVPETGYYQIGFRFKQNFIKQSLRRLYIDDEIPFDEAGEIAFPMGDRWQQCLAGNENPYLFYLTKGKHVIKMEVTLGSTSTSIIETEEILKQLNDANWQLMTVLGNSPDTNRDYEIEKFLPEVITTFRDAAAKLNSIAADWEKIAGERDSSIAEIQQLASQLDTMVKEPEKIPGMYSYFKDSLTSFSNLIISVRQQPLALDYLYLYEAGQELPEEKGNFFLSLKYGILRFFSSFVNDYDMLSAAEGETSITVWVGNGLSGGRDQAQALNQLIMQTFTPKTGIAVNLQLVPPNTVLTASLANKGPDVALQANASDPVNYAMRGAVEELSQYDGFDALTADFNKNSFTAFRYRDGVYALPETMTFPMMFYRKDIMAKLGIDIEKIKTWDDVRNILPTIQSNNMNFGLPALQSVTVSSAPNTYFMFLYQNGGEIYKNEGKASNLDDKTSLDAFYQYMRFYTSYGLPFMYNFETRFRTGELPIGIADYTTYNLLQISAPEIQGLWGMTTVPGMMQEDGSIVNTVPVTGTGAIMMKAAKEKKSCWEFLKWWVSADTQYNFGKDLESVMGIGARYNTANLKALDRLPWRAADRTVLHRQLDSVKGIPEVPGGYITTRNIDFAAKAVYNTNEDARNKLLSYVDSINQEILSKRREFRLDE